VLQLFILTSENSKIHGVVCILAVLYLPNNSLKNFILLNNFLSNRDSKVLKIIQHFSKHCSCHLQGESVMVGHFWQPYIGQAVGRELDSMVLIGQVEEWTAVQ
jgi:phosphatidylinositol kinase/protein kinase (PI-3  family)